MDQPIVQTYVDQKVGNADVKRCFGIAVSIEQIAQDAVGRVEEESQAVECKDSGCERRTGGVEGTALIDDGNDLRPECDAGQADRDDNDHEQVGDLRHKTPQRIVLLFCDQLNHLRIHGSTHGGRDQSAKDVDQAMTVIQAGDRAGWQCGGHHLVDQGVQLDNALRKHRRRQATQHMTEFLAAKTEIRSVAITPVNKRQGDQQSQQSTSNQRNGKGANAVQTIEEKRCQDGRDMG